MARRHTTPTVEETRARIERERASMRKATIQVGDEVTMKSDPYLYPVYARGQRYTIAGFRPRGAMVVQTGRGRLVVQRHHVAEVHKVVAS